YIFEPLSSEIEEDIKKNINALALNNKIFLVADSDNIKAGSKKYKRIQNLEQNKNIKTYIIKNIREIENILTKEIWIKTISFYCNKKLLDTNEQDITDHITNSLEIINPKNYKK